MRRFSDTSEVDRKPLTWNYVVSILKTFLHYYGPHRRLFALSMTCALAQAGFTTLMPLLAYEAFNTYLPAKDYPKIWFTVIALGILMILIAISMFVCIKYGHVLGVRMESDMRNDLFSHLQKLSFRYFDKTKTGHLMSRVTNDLTMIAELAHHGPEDISSAVVMMTGSMIIMFCINPMLTWITLIPIPFIFLWALLFQGKMRHGFRIARKEIAEINSQVENSIQGIREVKSFTNERREVSKFRRVNSAYRHAREKIFDSLAKFHSGIMFFIQGYSVLFIMVGLILMYFGKADIAQIITFFMYSKSISIPVMRIVDFTEQFHQGVTAYERFYEILQETPDIKEKSNPVIPAEPLKGTLEFDHVTFRYNDTETVLDDVTLSIPQGKTVALVGESGAGKTTIAALIPRFYDIVSGAIRIDGVDIRDYSLSYLRGNIGIVQQSPFLFDTTIRDNILFGRLDAREDELIEAAKNANIHDFIQSLPDGFDTPTGEHGVRLSGGQKQRISIARVFLKNPSVLIFDEATSALDNQSEALVQESMEKLCKGRTTLIIAHRLSTVKNADLIYCLRSGKVIEHGTHPELLALDGYYKKLYTMHTF